MVVESTKRSEDSQSRTAIDAPTQLRSLRRALLAILLFALTGTFVDLLLLDHYEDFWQVIPIALIALCIVTILIHLAIGNAASVRAVQFLMALLLCCGFVGGMLHYRASAAFHAELDRGGSRWEQMRAILGSKAPPVMAPALLLQMGLIGLAYAHRHPALRVGTTRRAEHSHQDT